MPRLVGSDNRNFVIETVKKAEDSTLTVVRGYECHNTRGRATVSAALPIKRAWRADLNEAKTAALEVVDGTVQIEYRPFEIVTLLVEF